MSGEAVRVRVRGRGLAADTLVYRHRPRHTSTWLIAAARGSFTSLGEISENVPYRGTYVPLLYYGQGDRVSSVMIELRRDTYLTDPRTSHPGSIAQIGRNLAALVDAVSDRAADV